MTDLTGKVLVVTGGSSGIGEQLVKQGSKAGAKICFSWCKGYDRAGTIARETGAAPFTLELSNSQSICDFLDAIEGLGTKLDYFIANAGTEFSGDLGKHDFEAISSVIDSNLKGNVYLLRELIFRGVMCPDGQISVIGSTAADGNHDQLAYSASKAGLRGVVETLRRYDAKVREQSLGVKLLEPAFVRTPMAERFLKLLERRVIPRKGGEPLLQQFRDSKLVMDVDYAASEILRLTVNPEVVGIRTIPEGVNWHKVRKTYFD